MEQVTPRQLQVGARIADALVYVAGLAGVVAGGLLFRDGQVAFATVAWTVTFVAGAGLRLAAWGARALALLLARSERIELELEHLRAAPRSAAPPPAPPPAPVDPWRRWGGWH